MFTFPNQVDNHQNESMIFKMPMIVMTMLMVMTFTMRLYQVYDDKDIYISWKRDSPSTPITKSALRAVLVQSHPASSPDDIIIMMILMMVIIMMMITMIQ